MLLRMVVLICSLGFAVPSACFAEPQATVVCPPEASVQETLAAKEIRRYVYLRTGKLLPIVETSAGDAIVVARKNRQIVGRLDDAQLKATIDALQPQQYVLKTITDGNSRIVLLIDGGDIGTLYGAYRFIEHLGVRFFMHGDAIPDKQITLKLPELDETGKPLFALRGVNPWGSHPFGFDAWNADQYKAHFAQLAKMRMNFLGIHCYHEPKAEPTVWMGLDGDFDEKGRVKSSYPSRYYNTALRGPWGPMLPNKTGGYLHGGSLLFESDDWGPDVMGDYLPTPTTPEACNDVFNRTGEQFREAFSFARLVGVKTCIGTEAPITMPKALKDRLKAQGKDPTDPAVVQEVYEAMFRRIAKTHPLDYYWLWTDEGWTWKDNTDGQLKAVMD
ncbi:hypothetical protein LCGC14_2726870, partial [marine sediment metagenome]